MKDQKTTEWNQQEKQIKAHWTTQRKNNSKHYLREKNSRTRMKIIANRLVRNAKITPAEAKAAVIQQDKSNFT